MTDRECATLAAKPCRPLFILKGYADHSLYLNSRPHPSTPPRERDMAAEFDPEMSAVMAEAYDRVCQSMRDWGQPLIIAEIIAKRIIKLAADGERNPDKLCDRALKSLGFGEGPGMQYR
jgi:hypothetical protein